MLTRVVRAKVAVKQLVDLIKTSTTSANQRRRYSVVTMVTINAPLNLFLSKYLLSNDLSITLI